MPPSIAHASSLQLPPGPWPTVYDALCARFPHVGASIWAERFARGLVCKAGGGALTIATPYRVGLEVRYWRELAAEPRIPGEEVIIHRDADLIVVDKPLFLPVAPTGAWVEQTLLRRLQRRLGIESLAPLHRIDRATAGLVMFSANPSSRVPRPPGALPKAPPGFSVELAASGLSAPRVIRVAPNGDLFVAGLAGALAAKKGQSPQEISGTRLREALGALGGGPFTDA